jgi:hypothetical protein
MGGWARPAPGFSGFSVDLRQGHGLNAQGLDALKRKNFSFKVINVINVIQKQSWFAVILDQR